MQKRIFFILFFASFCLTACHHLSDQKFLDNRGQIVQFSKLQGKWIFINYWATWCHACSAELPVLNAFYQYEKTQSVVVIGVNYDGLSMDALEATVRQLGIRFSVLLANPAHVLHLPPIGVVPTTFVINPDGKLVKTLEGPQTIATLRAVMETR